MASTTHQIVREAIQGKKQIVGTYDGHVREMCPHCIGRNKDGGEQALFFQFAGGSKTGLLPGGQWRCFELGKLQNAVIRDGQWHTGPSHTRPQSCVNQVDVEIAY